MNKLLKLQMILMLLVISVMGARADELTINDGGATNPYVPYFFNYGDGGQKQEFLILSSQIADINGGKISGMKFYTTLANSTPGYQWKVFMKEVEASNMASQTFFGPSGATEVFNGTITVSSNTITLNFSTEYEYNGGNLLVGIYTVQAGSYTGCDFYGANQSYKCSLMGYNQTENTTSDDVNGPNLGIATYYDTFLPKTTFTYTPGEGGGGGGDEPGGGDDPTPSGSFVKASDVSHGPDYSGINFTVDPITFSCAENSTDYGTYLQINNSANFTISAASGKEITKIEFAVQGYNTYTGNGAVANEDGTYAWIATASEGTFTGNEWTGTASSVTFTTGDDWWNWIELSDITVYYQDAGGSTEPEPVAKTSSVVFLKEETTQGATSVNQTKGSVKLEITDGYCYPSYYVSFNNMTLTALDGAKIVKVKFTDTNGWGGAHNTSLSASTGSFTSGSNTLSVWEGKADVVTFTKTSSSWVYYTTLEVTYEGGKVIVAKPTFSPAVNSYGVEKGTSVSISQPDAAMILYTTDGTDPSFEPLNGEEYTEPIVINQKTTIKAIALDEEGNASDVATAEYKIFVAQPQFTPSANEISSGTQVTITQADAAHIIYTTNQTNPTWNPLNGTEYTGPITVNNTTNFRAIAVDADGNESNITYQTYNVVQSLNSIGELLSSADGTYELNVPANTQLLFRTTDGAILYNSTEGKGVYVYAPSVYSSWPTTFGTSVTGKIKATWSNSWWDFESPSVQPTFGAVEEVTPVELAGAEVIKSDKSNRYAYVKLEGTFDHDTQKFTAKDGTVFGFYSASMFNAINWTTVETGEYYVTALFASALGNGGMQDNGEYKLAVIEPIEKSFVAIVDEPDGTVATFDPTQADYNNGSTSNAWVNWDNGDIHFNGYGRYGYADYYRIARDNDIKITANNGAKITKIEFVPTATWTSGGADDTATNVAECLSDDASNYNLAGGTMNGNVWTGEATEVLFYFKNYFDVTGINVTYTPGEEPAATYASLTELIDAATAAGDFTLAIADEYKVQVMGKSLNADYNNAIWLWDGTTGIELDCAATDGLYAYDAKTVFTGGTIKMTYNEFDKKFVAVSANGLTTEAAADFIAPVAEASLTDANKSAKLNNYLSVANCVVSYESYWGEMTYLLRDADDNTKFTQWLDMFENGVDFSQYVGKTGTVIGVFREDAAGDFCIAPVTTEAFFIENEEPVVVPDVLFEETFSASSPSEGGGRDNVFNAANSANLTTAAMNSGASDAEDNWTLASSNSRVYKAKECVKFGSASADGSMTTKAIALTGEGALSFNVAGWSDTKANTVKVDITGATFADAATSTTITVDNGHWMTKNLNIYDATGNVTLTFSGRRFFLDDIRVETGNAEIVEVSAGATGYATLYYSDKDFIVPDGLMVTTQAVVDGNLTATTTLKYGDTLPKGTGVVLVSTNSDETAVLTTAATYQFVVARGNGNDVTLGNNMLKGSDASATTVGDNADDKFYMLSKAKDGSGKIGFFYANGCPNGEAFTNGAHKAYLAVPADQAAAYGYTFDGSAVDAIESINMNTLTDNDEVYTVAGVRVQNVKNLQKGIYVVNGQRVAVK